MVPTDRHAVISTPGVLPAGMRLGKYEIVRQLGAGGMGAVYEGVHGEIGKRVAIKVLSPAVAAIPGVRARFLREAQLTSKVRHPHAVDVTDMGTEGDQTYLVMELLDGEDLGARLERTGRLDAVEMVDLVLPVCSAVAAAHKVGIIHRDLKPQNIFLAKGVHGVVPKVLDFGISKGQDGSPQPLTGTDALLGTPFYLAPEQVSDNRAAGPASDQYALGVVMYECLTGVRPFQAESLFPVLQAIVAGTPVPPRAHRGDLDPQLEAVVVRAMHVDPARRFPSVIALAKALVPFAGDRARLLWRDAFGAAVAETVDDRALRAASTPPGAGTPRPGATPPFATPPAVTPSGPVAAGTPPWPPALATPPSATPPAATPPFVFTTGGATPPPPAFRPNRAPMIVVVTALVTVAVGAIWLALGKREPVVTPTAPVAAPLPPAPAPATPPAPAPPPAAVAAPPAPPPVAAVAAPSEARSHAPSRRHGGSRTPVAPQPAAAHEAPAAPREPAPVAGPNNAPVIE
jgi:hypothetical protein